MKTVYFVRHGESEGNAGKIYQDGNSHLTDKGKTQAGLVAERCVKINFDVIISSTMVRAKDTAGIILSKVSKPIEYSDLFVERRRPSEFIGSLKDDPKMKEIEKTIIDNFHIDGFKYSDEENFEDLKNRARSALKYLEDMSEENILVVTHGFFMRIVVAYVTMGEKLTAYECNQFIRSFHTENVGITVLNFDEKSKSENKWWLWTWNDSAHLG